MQDKKITIDSYYEQFEEKYPDQSMDQTRFREVMNLISQIFPKWAVRDTQFRRPPLFYSLYCVVFHQKFGLPGVSVKRKRIGGK